MNEDLSARGTGSGLSPKSGDAAFQNPGGVEDPPVTLSATLSRLGPGLIIAGSIVGSGELIATTKTGAQAGMTLLWLILAGCFIKVFVQIELGRYTITTGNTCLDGLNRVPGPRWRVNWIVWYWLAMLLVSLGQLGGIVGGVGQAFALTFPFQGDYRDAVSHPETTTLQSFFKSTLHGESLTKVEEHLNSCSGWCELSLEVLEQGGNINDPYTWDDKWWALAITLITIAILTRGRYGLIQIVSTSLVASFTLLTLGNVLALQFTEDWGLSGSQLLSGLKFSFPRDANGNIGQGLFTALATFGIIGVGASELITYPYWCLEKGYARFTGPRTDDSSWGYRAQGWMRVMRYDAWLSMVVYTFATVAFYILGACVLNRIGEDPDGMRMVNTLAAAYLPVFGVYAKWLFLGGAIAVLYSTFFVANAGLSRIASDACRVFGLIREGDQDISSKLIPLWCTVFPLISLTVFLTGANPVSLVLASGVMQAIMLPMLGFASLYFRFRHSDARIRPGKMWDLFLWLSFIGLMLAGGFVAYDKCMIFF